MNLPRPTADKIFGERLEPKKKTNAGIILPVADLDKHQCKVLAVGPKVEVVSVGDTLRFDNNMAVDYEWNGKKCVFINENDRRGSVFIISK